MDNTGFKLWYTGTISNKNGARVPSGGWRAANVQMGVVLCGERRTWSRERRDYGSGGLAEFGLWRRVWDRVGVVAAGGFTFRVFFFLLFFSLSFLFYTARRQAPMTKIGRHESIPVPLSFFL